jgi:hypothetical protein
MPFTIPDDPRRRLREIRDIQKAARELTPERDFLIRHVLETGDSLRRVEIDSGAKKTRIYEIASGDRTLIDEEEP